MHPRLTEFSGGTSDSSSLQRQHKDPNMAIRTDEVAEEEPVHSLAADSHKIEVWYASLAIQNTLRIPRNV